jgi:lipopolysaccharide/colanic/teichoic acid biosynthesis glycosyltransferase
MNTTPPSTVPTRVGTDPDLSGNTASRDAGADSVRSGLGYRFFRRSVDVTVGSVGLVVAFPLFVVVAIVIALSGRGGLFFAQQRVGLRGEHFTLVKFRTMQSGTHDEVLADPEVFARYVANGYKLGEDDPRITRVGRWLRKTSLDELPQLINVLAGQMSVVGVRPLVPDEFAARAPIDRELYCGQRPGLTGLWQVAGRSSLEPDSRIELDREYLRNCSIRTDLKILLRTPAALIRTSHAQ